MGFDPIISTVRAGVESKNIRVYGVEWAGEETGPIPVTIKARKVGDVGWAKEVGVLVDRNGTIVESPTIAIQNAKPGTSYEVNAAYSLGAGPGLSAVVTMPYNLMGNYYLASNNPNEICTAEPVFLFSKEAFGEGVTMYYDSSLLNPMTEGYVSRKTYGPIHSVSGGVVGAATSYGCFNSISGKFSLADTMDICKTGFQVLYTNAPDLNNLVGYEMFYDRAMMNQTLGHHYLLNAANGTIYSIDDIESSLVLDEVGQCEDFYNLKINNNAPIRVIDMVSAGTNVYNDDILPGDSIAGTHAGVTAAISVNLIGGGSCDNCDFSELVLYKGTNVEQTMKVKDGLYRFSAQTFAPNDEITIELNNIPPEI